MRKIIFDSFVVRIILIFLLIPFLGCHKAISVKDAQVLTLKFHGETLEPPPRRLGTKIEQIVEYYQKNIISLYAPPEYTLSEFDELVDFYKGSNKGYFYLQEDARRCYFLGYMDQAILYSKASIGVAPGHSSRTIAELQFDQAMILAESGDFIGAKHALARARNNYYGSFGSNKLKWQLKSSYLSSLSSASIKFAEGDMKGAETYFYKALDCLTQIRQLRSSIRYSGQSYLLAHVKIGIASSLLWQGKLIEAESWARTSLEHSGHYYMLPRILITLSQIFYEQGRFEDSKKIANTVINMFTMNDLPNQYSSAPGSLVLASSREALSRVFIAQEDYAQALAQYDLIQKEMAADPKTYEQLFEGRVDRGMALFFNGYIQEAQDQFLLAYEKAKLQFGKNDYTVSEAQALYALTLSAKGNDVEALKILDQFMMDFISRYREQLGATIGYYTRKIRLDRILEGYVELLFRTGDTLSAIKAFEAVDAIQCHSVDQALSRSANRFAIGDPELVAIIRQKQDLEMNITANKNRIAASMGIDDIKHRDKVIKELKTKGDELRDALHVLNKEIAYRYPQYNKLTSPGSVSLTDIKKKLKKDEAILSIFTGQKSTYVWAFGKTGEVAFASIPISSEVLGREISRLRKSLTPNDIRTVEDIPTFDTELSYKLYRKLLAPVKQGWENSRVIMVAANAPMDRLPISLLISKPVGSIQHKSDIWFSEYKTIPWLARTHAVSQLPSVESILYLRNRKSSSQPANTFAGFGDPWFSPDSVEVDDGEVAIAQRGLHLRATPVAKGDNLSSFRHSMLPRLPETADEVRQIALAVGADPTTDVFLGLEATEARIKNMDLMNKRIIVFATHGLMPGDIDGLGQPALALSHPSLLHNKDDDGLLTMGEIMWLKLNADWVVLSACNTAAPKGKGKEMLSGLGQAFFYAGAKSLLATSWPVETNSAKALTTGLFKYIDRTPNISKAEALRLSRIALIDGPGQGKCSYAHPIFWAPFILAGDGGL
ncbi:CHAT domain-containing protein [Desulfosarcina ovata]|uniref:CHAT domain-containing protein n=1 Tax=Desulfosarcina ovata subsp. ovata TaxID=2752305 RepID=A0A5K8AB01_9BACT|nr:CHAT domain-containing tetratricopeptide repeat protein [Desulfosarcina ovata]BBO89668.1 hypothetical protein DSCOOX_28480 [Desulfosarcina ovata subsp. ovata]